MKQLFLAVALCLSGCMAKNAPQPNASEVKGADWDDPRPSHGQYSDFGQYFAAKYPPRMQSILGPYTPPFSLLTDIANCLYPAMKSRMSAPDLTALDDFARGNRPMTVEMRKAYIAAIPNGRERDTIYATYCPEKIEEFKAAMKG